MATIKSFTSLEQSMKLAEILPIESSDMIYVHTIDLEGDEHYDIDFRDKNPLFEDDVCAWSLAALLGVLPNYQLQTQDDGIGILCSCDGKFNIVTADNPVDACVAMIEKLNELNLL